VFAPARKIKTQLDLIPGGKAPPNTCRGTGSHAITASYHPDFNFGPNSASVAERVIANPTVTLASSPNPSLLVFTDLDAAQMVEGEALGMYGGPVPGTRLLSGLAGVEALVVNHGSPREQQWYIGAVGFQVAGGWSSAITVEHALAERGNGPAPAAALLGHTYQLLLEQATRSLAQVYLPDIDGAVAVAFTASDRAEEFVSCLPRETRPLADLAPLAGHQLFEMMRSVGAAGLVINAGSDDQTALTREDITEILSS